MFKLCLEGGDRRILTYTRADELIERFGAGERPDLIITDFNMPGMTGNQLAEKARELAYAGPILLLTARGAAGVPHVPAVTRYGSKPIGVNELRALVAELLVADAPAA